MGVLEPTLHRPSWVHLWAAAEGRVRRKGTFRCLDGSVVDGVAAQASHGDELQVASSSRVEVVCASANTSFWRLKHPKTASRRPEAWSKLGPNYEPED